MDFDDFFGPSTTTTTTATTTAAPSNSNAASSSSFDLDDFLMSSSPSPAQNPSVGQMHTTHPTTINHDMNNFMSHTQPHQQPSADFDDDFGDFQEGMEELPQTTTTNTHSPRATTRTITPTPTSMDMTTPIPTFTDHNNNHNNNKFEDLFSSSPVNTTTITTETNVTNNNDNNEDFGDFGDFEQPVEEATTTTSSSSSTINHTHNNNNNDNNNDNMMMNDDDDDNFFSSPPSNTTTTVTTVTTAKTVKTKSDDIMSFFDNDTTTTTTVAPLSSSSSSSSLFIPTDHSPNNNVHHHQQKQQKQQKEEEEQQSQSFEANFDDDWGDFVEPTNTTTTTTTTTTATFTTINSNDYYNNVSNVNNDEVMKEEKERDRFEFQVNFDQEQSNNDDPHEKQEEKKVDQENAEKENEDDDDDLIKEPVGTDESAIFNRLIFHERFKDAQHFISNTESLMIMREKMDHFKLKVWRSLLRLSIILSDDDDDITRQNESLEQRYVNEFEKKKLNIDTLNHGSRRLLIPMVNWQVSHEKFVSVSIVPQLHPTVQLVIQGLKEVESCVQLFDTVRLEKEREIEVVEQVFRSEKLNQFLRGVIEVYTMIELCLLELRSRTEAAAAAVMSSRRRFNIEQFCDIVQNRLITFRDLCQQVKTEIASQTSSTQLLEQVGSGTVATSLFVPSAGSEAGNGGDGSRRCGLTGRRLSQEKNELDQFEQFGPVYAPYKKFYSQRIRTLN